MSEPMLEYAIVPDAAINPSYGRAVGRVIAAAGQDLRMSRLGVRFVIEADRAPARWERLRVPDDDDPNQWDGRHTPAWTLPERPGLIYLHLFWSGSVVQVLFHEARHVSQQDRDPKLIDPAHFRAEYDRLEADAVAYAAGAMERLHMRESSVPDRRLRSRY